jgi:hypothetical protein
MRYLLMIYSEPWDNSELSPEEQAASMEEWAEFTAEVRRRDVMEAGEALEGIQTATTVRVNDGDVLTTDGPFAETAEVLGGFYLLNVKDLDEAIEIASICPGAKYGSIELRPIVEFGEEYQQAIEERAGAAG